MPRKPSMPTVTSLAEKADQLHTIREHRLEVQKQADELEATERALRAEIIAQLQKTEATGISGRLVRVSLTAKSVPQVQDWDALYTYIKGHDAFDLLQRRLSDAAVKERWEDQRVIPGVGTISVTNLSINKL